MQETSFSWSRFALLCVDYFTRFKIARFLQKTINAAEALLRVIVDHTAPAGLTIGVIRTDRGGGVGC